MLLSSTGESIFQLVVVLVIFVIILVLTYYTTKWIAGYQKTASINKNLEVIETVRLTTDKYVQLVRAGENRCFVIAVGKNEVSLLGEISIDELREYELKDSDSSINQFDFKSVLDKFTGKNKDNEQD